MGRVCPDGKKSTVELPTHRREKWNDGDVEGRRVRGTQMRNCARCLFFPQGSGPRRGRGGCSCSSVTSSIAPFSLPFPRVLGIEGGSSSFSSGREGGKLPTSHPPEPVVDKGERMAWMGAWSESHGNADLDRHWQRVSPFLALQIALCGRGREIMPLSQLGLDHHCCEWPYALAREAQT